MSFVEDIAELVLASTHPLLACHADWERRPLGNVAQIINGFAFPSNQFNRETGWPLVRIRDVLGGRSETYFAGSVPEGFWVDDDDLLVGMDGDFNIGRWRGGRALLNQRVCKIIPDTSQIIPSFLFYVLPGYLKLINDHTSSTTVKHLSSRTLAAIPLPLPPLDTQRRIVDRIDELFSELDDGEAALGRARDDLETYRKSLLKAAVTGELTAEWRDTNSAQETGAQLIQRILAVRKARWEADEALKGKVYKQPIGPDLAHCPDLPDDWTWCSLDQLCFHITSGSRAWSPYYGRGQSVFIMAQNVRAGYFDTDFVQLVDPPENDPERRRTRVKQGDLLLTIVGANTGDLCRINFEPTDHYVCQSVALLRPVVDWIGELCEFFFAGSFGRKLQMDKLIYGAGRPHLSFDQIRSLAVPIPPMVEAAKVIEEVRAVRDQVADLGRGLQAPSTAPQHLRKSILAAAFRGDLSA